MKTSLVRYPGGKTRLSRQLHEHMHATLDVSASYCESFVGGGGMLLPTLHNYRNITKVFINDLDLDIYSMWSSLVHNPLDVLYLLKSYECSVAFFESLLNQTPQSEVERAARTFFLRYTSFGAFGKTPIGGWRQESNFRIDHFWKSGNPIKTWKECSEELRNIDCTVTNRHAGDVPGEVLADVLYLDPPYVVQGKSLYNVGATDDLPKTVRSLSKAWVSYDDHEVVREVFADRKIVEIYTKYTQRTDRENKTKHEVLIYPEGKE